MGHKQLTHMKPLLEINPLVLSLMVIIAVVKPLDSLGCSGTWRVAMKCSSGSRSPLLAVNTDTLPSFLSAGIVTL